MFKANKQYIASYDYEGVLNTFIGKYKVLLAAGIDVNFKTEKEGYTALQLAGKVPFKEFVAMFKKAGAR